MRALARFGASVADPRSPEDPAMSRRALAVLAMAMISSSASAAPIGVQSMRVPPPTPQPQATVCGTRTPKLEYSNGPLIQHVKVFDVFYNTGNPYKEMLAGFYTTILKSAHIDMLVEYNVANYKISRGSYLGAFEDTKSAAGATTLSDSQVEAYLSTLIDAKKVPAPDDDMLYMLYFPANVTITLQGAKSCQQFCAFHSSYTKTGQLVRYGVMPDVNAGACAGGCGPGNQFENLTDVSSHELVEAITDPDNGTGWYDNPNATNPNDSCGEIGDICATNQGETGIVDGYTVQKEWSNKLNDCVVTNPNISVNDFTVAVSPSPVLVPVGGSATATVTLTKKSGMTENVTLTTMAMSTEIVGAFAPASVLSDTGTSMLTIIASPTAAIGSMQKLTVKAAGTVVSSTAEVAVTIVAPVDMAMSGNHGRGNGDKSGGCSMAGAGIGGTWALGGLVLLALALRRRRV
jgi:MYXO-CTERM domain-containing protein